MTDRPRLPHPTPLRGCTPSELEFAKQIIKDAHARGELPCLSFGIYAPACPVAHLYAAGFRLDRSAPESHQPWIPATFGAEALAIATTSDREASYASALSRPIRLDAILRVIEDVALGRAIDVVLGEDRRVSKIDDVVFVIPEGNRGAIERRLTEAAETEEAARRMAVKAVSLRDAVWDFVAEMAGDGVMDLSQRMYTLVHASGEVRDAGPKAAHSPVRWRRLDDAEDGRA